MSYPGDVDDGGGIASVLAGDRVQDRGHLEALLALLRVEQHQPVTSSCSGGSLKKIVAIFICDLIPGIS